MVAYRLVVNIDLLNFENNVTRNICKTVKQIWKRVEFNPIGRSIVKIL